MKQLTIFTALLLILSLGTVYSQGIGVNNDGSSPDGSAMLDIKSTTKGILVPRVTLTQTTSNAPIGAGVVTSLLIYNTATVNDVAPGYYYWDGSQWVRLLNTGNSTGLYWSLTGNAGTADGTNFVGTTDNVPLNFRVNNEEAGRIGTSTDGSTFLGYQAGLNDDHSNNKNTFIGYMSGLNNTTGYGNTTNGFQSLKSNTSGANNTANGYQALSTNTTGTNNTANGYDVLLYNTTGYANTAIGNYALCSNRTGYNNTAIGHLALNSNNANSGSVALGYGAMEYADDRTTGRATYNTAIGYQALRGSKIAINNTGQYNTSVGFQSLYVNTTGYSNTANGYQALHKNTEGNYNTSNGYYSLSSNTTGYGNTANGASALYSNTTGSYNTANGVNSLSYNTAGSYNTANGNKALYNNTTGNYNTANGLQAIMSNTTGYNNTANGYQALYNNTTGYDNTAIGYSAFSSGSNYSNSTGLGYDAEPGANNTVRIGNSSVSTIGGFADWSNVSDKRFKTNIKENVAGLDFIMKLRPVTYQLDMDAMASFLKTPDSLRLQESEKLKAAEIQIGFIAQEVEQAAQSLSFDFHGVDKPKNKTSYYALRYAEFVVPLVKAVQEQQKNIEKLETENAEFKAQNTQLKKMLKTIKQRLEILENK